MASSVSWWGEVRLSPGAADTGCVWLGLGRLDPKALCPLGSPLVGAAPAYFFLVANFAQQTL